jgi:hypothetical protein
MASPTGLDKSYIRMLRVNTRSAGNLLWTNLERQRQDLEREIFDGAVDLIHGASVKAWQLAWIDFALALSVTIAPLGRSGASLGETIQT